jgi:hypothetical protein
MGRKSQVDKFNAKLSKKEVDEQAINTRAYQKKQEELRIYGAEGVDELMSHGNIKEAAVVFSREGMQAFANMFGNSMESAVVNVLDNHIGKITQTMEERMEAIIEAKMMEMIEGMTEGMKQFNAQMSPQPIIAKPSTQEFMESLRDVFSGVKGSDVSKAVVETEPVDGWKTFDYEDNIKEPEKVIEPIETPMIDWDKAFKIDKKEKEAKIRPVVADAPRPKKSDYFSDIDVENIEGLSKLKHPSGYRYGSSKSDIAVVAPYILSIFKKYEGKEIMSATILKVLRKEYGIRLVNATMTLRKVMALDPNFENVGFGVYKYEEKNFRPTV